MEPATEMVPAGSDGVSVPTHPAERTARARTANEKIAERPALLKRFELRILITPGRFTLLFVSFRSFGCGLSGIVVIDIVSGYLYLHNFHAEFLYIY